MALTVKYVVINNRLVPLNTAHLVKDQLLGVDYSFTRIILRPNGQPLAAIEHLLTQARTSDLSHNFPADQIEAMLQKFEHVNGPSDQDIQLIIASGRTSLLFIGYEDFPFKDFGTGDSPL